MKTIILCLLLLVGPAHALPVLNANTGGAEMVTIFPDHLDPNLYYTSPHRFAISRNGAGVPNFSYTEYRLSDGSIRALIQTTLGPDFSDEAMAHAKANVLKHNPNARFAALPFASAAVTFSGEMTPFFVGNDCNHLAGTVGDEQVCVFNLRSQGVKVIRKQLKNGIAIAAHFEFSVEGVNQNADGSYVNDANSYKIAAIIGGAELAEYPELFQDHKGNPILNQAPALGGLLADVPGIEVRGGIDSGPPQPTPAQNLANWGWIGTIGSTSRPWSSGGTDTFAALPTPAGEGGSEDKQ